MDLALTEEQSILRDGLSRYLSEKYSFEHRRDRLAGGLVGDDETWRALALELGVLGVGFDPELGGLGVGPVETMIVMEALGRHLVLEPFLETVVLCGGILRRSPAPMAKALIERIVQGEARLAFAYAEPQGRYCWRDVAVEARRQGAGYVLSGRKAVVIGGPVADVLLVTARTSGERRDAQGISVVAVDARQAGVTRRDYRTIDGKAASEISFEDVEVAEEALLTGEGDALPLVELAIDEATVAVCAEAVGILQALLETTVEYAKQRRQFGVTLSSFQALQHRMVDMLISVEKAASMTLMARQALDGEAEDRARAVSAAKAQVGAACRFVGQSGVQLHGAIGITDELAASHLFKRATVIESQFGSTDHHLARYARLAFSGASEDRAAPQGVDDDSSPEDRAFRAEVRAFLAQKLDGELRAWTARQAGVFAEGELSRRWHRILYEQGWVAPSWPQEFGGPGWTAKQRIIFRDECARAGAPVLPVMGLTLCAPVIMKYGAPEQQAYFLPRMLSGEHYWCQGFSEPGSGSDLASLQMRAVRDGDDYVVNGSKIWTTHAQYANWIFLLVRTSTEGKPQQGISFLVCPLDTPGITVRPIISMSGEHEVNQVFFDDVRIPVANRFGAENEGWSVAKYLLGFERGGAGALGVYAAIENLKAIARREAGDLGGALIEDPDFRHKLARLEGEVLALDWLGRRLDGAGEVAERLADVAPSIKKLLTSEVSQHIAELTVEALGLYGAADQRAALGAHPNESPIGPDYAATPTAKYLNGRASTIFGGSSEVQRGIIGRMALGL